MRNRRSESADRDSARTRGRIFPRLTVRRVARLHVAAESVEVEVVNISLRGAFFSTTAPLHVGQRVELHLVHRGSAEIVAPASVLYRVSRGYGCAFDPMSLAQLDRLKSWIAGEAGANERRIRSERVDLLHAEKLARVTACGEVLAVMEQVFSSLTAQATATYVQRIFDQEFLQKSVHLFRNRDNVCVGFNLVWVPKVSLPGGDHAVFRSVAAILPEYRGENSTLGGAFEEALRFKVRFPQMPVHLFLRLMHPSSYRLFSRHAPVLHERFDDSAPPDIRALAMACICADDYPWKQRESGAIVQQIAFAVSDSKPEAERWKHEPNVARYLQNNPDYAQGWGLCTLIPMDASNLVQAYRSYLERRVRRLTQQTSAYRGRGVKMAALLAEALRADKLASSLRGLSD